MTTGNPTFDPSKKEKTHSDFQKLAKSLIDASPSASLEMDMVFVKGGRIYGSYLNEKDESCTIDLGELPADMKGLERLPTLRDQMVIYEDR